jgi:hypothetical protein
LIVIFPLGMRVHFIAPFLDPLLRRAALVVEDDDAWVKLARSHSTVATMCDLIFPGVFERHPRLTLAIVEFELAWAPYAMRPGFFHLYAGQRKLA